MEQALAVAVKPSPTKTRQKDSKQT